MLDAHHPYPGVVIDRQWNVVLANRAASALTDLLPAHVKQPTLNVFRISLHPDGLAAITLNFREWAGHLLRQLRRSVQITGDARLAEVEAEVHSYPNVAELTGGPEVASWDEPPLLVPFTIRTGSAVLSMFTTLTSFGTPRDVTLDELSVELFFPADDDTDRLLHGAP
jgi:hypothetical protein